VSDPARCVVLERRAVGGPAVLMERARDAVRQAIGRALPADRAAIVLAFATGEQAGIGPTDVEVFRIAGLSHLMAVSGLNVAIIAGLALVGLRWLLGRSAWIGLGFGAERASVVLAVPLVVAYAGFVGGQPSALRAVLMMLVVLLAVALRRQADALTSVAWAVIVLVAWRPSWAGDPGLQLSVGALLGLLVLDPWLAARIEARARVEAWPWLLRAGLAVGRASASATLATRQSQTLLSDADTLDAKADIEEGASASVVATAKIQRRRAAAIRVQAFQTPEPSQSALLARAAKLNADAAANEASSKTFLARAKVIRSRADALRALSTRVLASGVVTTQVLPAVQLLAPPAGHPDRTALVSLEAAPRVARRPMMSVAGI